MVAALVDDRSFLDLVERHGPTETAKRIGCSVRAVFKRRQSLEVRLGRQVKAGGPKADRNTRRAEQHPYRLQLDISDGVVICGSDAHYWPGIVSTAHRAFCHLARELQPKAVVMNGDAFDGARISRHSPIGWENRPEVVAELEATKERLAEIERAAPNAKRYWPLGNHDGRFETRLATVAPEYARINGFHLKDHIPYWHPCWAVWCNDDVVIKHRFKSGIHAPHNNTKDAGTSFVTGHLHSLKVQPWTDYRGTRFGVDCGTMADIYGPQFVDYTEDNPRNWRSGFVVLTFHKGRLLWPELVHVIDDGVVEFRGKVIEVGDAKAPRKR